MRQNLVPELDPGKHICLIGQAFPEVGNPIRVAHEKLILVIVVEKSSGDIVDCEVNFACQLSAEFIRAIYVGKNLVSDFEKIQHSIQNFYYGTSSKALIVATRSVINRFHEIQATNA